MSSLLSGVGVALLFVSFERLGDGPLAVALVLSGIVMIGVSLSRELF